MCERRSSATSAIGVGKAAAPGEVATMCKSPRLGETRNASGSTEQHPYPLGAERVGRLREGAVRNDQPAALQLRYLQTLVEIGADKNTTIVFPLPIDIITSLGRALERSSQPGSGNP